MFGLKFFDKINSKSDKIFREKGQKIIDKIPEISIDNLESIIRILETSFQSENSKDYIKVNDNSDGTSDYWGPTDAIFFNQHLRSLIIILKNERRKMIEKLYNDSWDSLRNCPKGMQTKSP